MEVKDKYYFDAGQWGQLGHLVPYYMGTFEATFIKQNNIHELSSNIKGLSEDKLEIRS